MERFNLINIIDLYGVDEIFKGIELAKGIDRDTTINAILDECASYEPVYYDMPLLNNKIRVFFKKNYDVFKRLNDAFNAEYNPIENYDKNMETHNNVDTAGTHSESGTESNQNTDTNTVSAYDSNTFTNDNQTITNGTNSNSLSGKDNQNEKSDYTEHVHGNIGVTTSQQMLKSELDLRPELNIYKVIANTFYDEFMLKLL